MITGDRNFSASPRAALQAAAVAKLVIVFMGPGSWWPAIPEGSFDVVTAQDPLLRGAFARRAAKKIGARLNVQVHMDLWALPWWKRILAQIILRKADSVRVVSEKIKKQAEAMGVKAPIHVLPVFIELSRFRSIVRNSSKSDLLDKTILWIGRFEAEKDPALALSVLQAVQSFLPDAKLIMLGAGNLEQSLKARVHAAGLRVEFPGWVDPAPYLQTADVVLCTSKHESWGASIVEALAAGVPVVAPDVGIAREAGAIVMPRSDLGLAVTEVLRTGARGELRLPLLDAASWVTQWKGTLV